jgi:hypothetical protein
VRLHKLAVLAVIVAMPAIVAGGQAQPTELRTSEGVAYLLRMERLRRTEDVCVLIRGDGQYHLERLVADKARIFEGALDAPTLQNLEHILADGELFQLTQDKIIMPLISEMDELDISVLRPGHWQNLRFPPGDSRAHYGRILNPLIKWFENIQREQHRELSEDAARNSCLPTRTLELKTRGPAASGGSTAATPLSSSTTSATNNYVFRLESHKIGGQTAENTCIIVYPDGRYHLERKTQRIASKEVSIAVFEDAVWAGELQKLTQILDNPELQKKTYEEPPYGRPMLEAEFTSLTVPRVDHLQKVSIWRGSEFRRLGSIGGPPPLIDHGSKLLKPLQQWLKNNIEQRKTSALPGTTPSKCVPAL